MALAFGGDPSHVTIRSWVKNDHPLLFKSLERHKGEWSPDSLERSVGPTEDQRILARLHSLLVDVVALSKSIESASGQQSIESMAKKALEAIVSRKPYSFTPVSPEGDF
jgi:hypothetical protein